MTRLVRLDFCCNDPDNGQFAGRIAGVQLPDMDLELAADDMVGPVFRLLPADRMRVGRRVFRWEWSKEWFGNWCWNAYYFEPAVAVELLASLHGSGRFHVECGEERLFARWKDTTTTLKASGALRANDAAGQSPSVSHGFWTGNAATLRYLRLALTQPAGNPVLQAGNVMVGSAFQPTWNKEWGSGRQVIDTGSATRLPGGGFAMVEGARPGSYRWTLGDLTDAEVDTLYALQMDRGETRPILVVEDPAATTGLRNRIHYGRFTSLRAYERRNPKQTRWDFSMEEWI